MDCPNPKRSAVDGLPEDSLAEILARGPVRSVYRSKCVAKGWRDLIEDPLHGKKIPQTLLGFFSIDRQIYGRGFRRSGGAHVGFTSLRARSAPLGIDSRLSFITDLPETKLLTLADSCNGLLLFNHGAKSGPSDGLGYIVCNPATKHWVSVHRYDCVPPPNVRGESRYTYLVFDPVVSHFHIVQFWLEFKQVITYLLGSGDDSPLNGSSYDSNDDDVITYLLGSGDDSPLNGSSYDSNDDDDDEEEGEVREVYRYQISVHVYSSETSTWSHIQNDWDDELGQLEEWRHRGRFPGHGCIPCWGPGCAVLNSELHFIISDQERDQDQIVAVDVHGETQRIIPLPAMAVRKPGYIAQSQGRLHYINQASDAQLSIWVLEDTQKWVLKHSVIFVVLFGRRSSNNEYRVVAMHPDGNVVFIVQNQKLISYDMHHKLATVIATSENNISAKHIVPYVPCFLESPALTNKH